MLKKIPEDWSSAFHWRYNSVFMRYFTVRSQEF